MLQAKAEVERLNQLKASKMKELVVKKQSEVENICRRSHMEVPPLSELDHIINTIKHGRLASTLYFSIINLVIDYIYFTQRARIKMLGDMDYGDLLNYMDEEIAKAEDEALSRKMIIEKVEKWVLARDEERWLEEYNMVS